MRQSSVAAELQSLREQLQRSEVQRKALESRLSEADGAGAQLHEEGNGAAQVAE